MTPETDHHRAARDGRDSELQTCLIIRATAAIGSRPGHPPPSGTSTARTTDAAIDPDRFRGQEQRPVGHQNQLRDPISGDWLTRAALLPGRSLQVAMALWSISGVTGLRCLPLSNRDVKRFGLDRNAKYRGLACLEGAGLVAIKRKVGRAPMVTILDAEAEP